MNAHRRDREYGVKQATYCPRAARLSVRVPLSGGLDREQSDPVRGDVVRMPGPAERVVADDHLRAERPDDLHDPADCVVNGLGPERMSSLVLR